VLPRQTGDVVLKNANRLGAILLVVADHDDALGQQ
jgi:hypothetical protein